MGAHDVTERRSLNQVLELTSTDEILLFPFLNYSEYGINLIYKNVRQLRS